MKSRQGVSKLTAAQTKVIERWRENPDWLIVEVRNPAGVWFFKDPTKMLDDRVHRWVFGGLRFRELIRFRERAVGGDFYELTPAGRALVEASRREK